MARMHGARAAETVALRGVISCPARPHATCRVLRLSGIGGGGHFHARTGNRRGTRPPEIAEMPGLSMARSWGGRGVGVRVAAGGGVPAHRLRIACPAPPAP
eukprot:6799367-Prymnesium_polylepis.1